MNESIRIQKFSHKQLQWVLTHNSMVELNPSLNKNHQVQVDQLVWLVYDLALFELERRSKIYRLSYYSNTTKKLIACKSTQNLEEFEVNLYVIRLQSQTSLNQLQCQSDSTGSTHLNWFCIPTCNPPTQLRVCYATGTLGNRNAAVRRMARMTRNFKPNSQLHSGLQQT